ncbi:hypothetical protein, partial [Sideroxydans sp. CL21]
ALAGSEVGQSAIPNNGQRRSDESGRLRFNSIQLSRSFSL